MTLCSPAADTHEAAIVERAKPLLGTFVRVRVEGLSERHANAAIDAAFDEIAQIHALMSFHEAGSDVSRLNRNAHRDAVAIDPRTAEVLVRASAIAALSQGAFDITIAPHLVARGLLPHPDAPAPDPTACWRDIAPGDNGTVRFARPLWVDLGGIAKGYAVDRGMARLAAFAPAQASINAGGDLCVRGPRAERIALEGTGNDPAQVPVIELRDGCLASSAGTLSGSQSTGDGPHIDTRHGWRAGAAQFVSVCAPRCIDADALTKVVMAKGACAAPILHALNAQAFIHDAAFGWRAIGGTML